MRLSAFTFVLYILAIVSYGQSAQTTVALTVPEHDRISVVKTSVRVAEWHEKSFWRLYDKYLADAVKGYSLTYRSLADLAHTDKMMGDDEAFQNGKKLLTYRNEELVLRKRYYQEIGAALNGIVAFQFLQTEAMMDMIESSEIYSRTPWKNHRFHSRSLSPEQMLTAKHNILAAALSIAPEKEQAFWGVFEKFEEECNAVMGEDYSLYTLFASDASDFTPALAKRLGHDLLEVMDRENKLKEKYFSEMTAAVGSNLATRFLAWQDYHSIIYKMHAWAETP